MNIIPSGTTIDRTIKSGVWVAGINILDRLLQLIKLGVLARILSARDFGLLGIGLLVLGGLKKLSDLGIEQELIQRDTEDVNSSLNTVWILKIARGLLIFVIAFILAPQLSELFSEPRATNIIRVIGITPLITGLENPAIVYFQKDIEFHKEFVLNISKSAFDATFSIIFAFILGSVWALVLGVIIGNVARSIVSFGVHNFRPRLSFNINEARQIIGYGKWITGGSIIIFFTTQGDDTFVAWFLTATALGYYQVAYRFGKAPATEISSVVNRLLFPTFSEFQDDISKTTETFRKAFQLTSFLSIPTAAGIIVVAPMFVETVLGEDWRPAVVLMMIVGIHGFFTSIGSLSGPIVMANGRPDLRTKWQLANFGMLAVLIYPLSDLWGVTGTAVSVVIASSVSTGLALYVSTSFMRISILSLVRELCYPVAASSLMTLVVFWLYRVVPFSGIILLIFNISVGAICYTVFIIILEKYTSYQILSLLQDLRSRLN